MFSTLRAASRTYTRAKCVRFSSTNLRDTLREVIPQKKELLKEIKANHGEKSLGDIQVNNLLGGMRGLKCMLWEASVLDPNEGIRFHGKSIKECQQFLPTAPEGGEMLPESMLWFLFTGQVPSEKQVRALSKELAEKGELPDFVKQTLTNLPPTLHPMSQFSIAVTALNHDSTFAKAYERGIPKNDYWEYVFDDVIDLTAKLPQIAAIIYQNTYQGGGPLKGDISLSNDWSKNFARMLGLEQSEGFVDLLRLYFALHGDHEGGNASAHATHLVGSTLADPYLSYSAGLQALAGPLHGLAAQEVLRFVKGMEQAIPDNFSSADVENHLWTILKSGRVVPGYGHAVLRQPDPRFEALMAFANSRQELADDKLFQLVQKVSHVAPSVLKEHGKTKNPFPNVDSISGTLFHHYGINETLYYTVTFGVCRALGPLPQLVWDRILGLPIERPKSLSLEKILEHVNK